MVAKPVVRMTRCTSFVYLVFACVMAHLAAPSHAYSMASTTWLGTVSKDWQDADNWEPPGLLFGFVPTGGAPAADKPTQINTTTPNPTVLGSGSASSGELQIGSGDLTIRGGADLGVTGSARIGIAAGIRGAVTITGAGSALNSTAELFVGDAGIGALTIAGGGAVSNTIGRIGAGVGGVGTAVVSGSGSIWSNSTSLFVGGAGSGMLTIADSARVSAGSGTGIVTIAELTGSIGVLNIGASSGAAAASPGTLEAAAIVFGDGSGTLNFNHTGMNYAFAPEISGNGAVSVASGITILTANSGAFSGNTSVTGGKLLVNGALGGTVNVAGGAVLGGAGTVGATTIGAGAVIAPGNSIGTLTVNGNLNFAAGSSYQVEVDPTGTSSDLIVVNGIARLAGSVAHIGEDGEYKPDSEYKILTATGGFDGTTFDGARSNYAFLDALLAYGANDVTLRLERNDRNFASVATTPNQRSTAGGLESLKAGNPLYEAIVRLVGPTAQEAFEQLSGEVHTSGIPVLTGGSGNVRGIVSQRFQGTFGGTPSASAFPLTSYASYGSYGASDLDAGGPGRDAIWGQVFGSWGRTSGDTRGASIRHDDGGFLVGADAVLSETWRVGAFGGYSRSTFSAADRASSGSSDNFHLGLHAGTEIGALRMNASAALTWHGIKTRRNVAFPGFTETLSAAYQGRTVQIFGEAGYRIGVGALAFEPFAGIAYVHTAMNAFSETGGVAALTAARNITASTSSTLGLRASAHFEVDGIRATLRGMAGWRHAFGNTTPTTRFNFAGGSSFNVSGTPIAKDAALVEAGMDIALNEGAIFELTYDGQYSRRSQQHGFNARLRVAF